MQIRLDMHRPVKETKVFVEKKFLSWKGVLYWGTLAFFLTGNRSNADNTEAEAARIKA